MSILVNGIHSPAEINSTIKISILTSWHTSKFAEPVFQSPAACISCKFHHQMAPLAFVANLARSVKIYIPADT